MPFRQHTKTQKTHTNVDERTTGMELQQLLDKKKQKQKWKKETVFGFRFEFLCFCFCFLSIQQRKSNNEEIEHNIHNNY